MENGLKNYKEKYLEMREINKDLREKFKHLESMFNRTCDKENVKSKVEPKLMQQLGQLISEFKSFSNDSDRNSEGVGKKVRINLD